MHNIESFYIIPYIKTILSALLSFAERLTTGKYWAVKVTLIVLVTSLFMTFPSFQSLPDNLNSGRAQEVAMQVDNLFEFWQLHNASHTMFRITVPLIAKIFNLNILGTYILQFFSGILIFFLSALIVERETKSRLTAFLVALSIGFIYAGSAAFVETRANYDSVAFFFLLAAMWFRSPLIIGPSILLATFTDERAVIAAGFVFLWWILQTPYKENQLKAFINPRSISVFIAVVVYLVIRIILMTSFGLISFYESRGEFELFNQINNAPMGIWTGLEGGWLIVLLAVGALFKQKRTLILLFFVFLMSAQVLGALAVVDITRSMAYLLPALLVAVLVLENETHDDFKPLYLIAAAVSLIWLTYYAGGKSTIWLFYPLPIQVVRIILKL